MVKGTGKKVVWAPAPSACAQRVRSVWFVSGSGMFEYVFWKHGCRNAQVVWACCPQPPSWQRCTPASQATMRCL